MPMNVLLGKPPKMQREVTSAQRTFAPLDLEGVDLQAACISVLANVESLRFIIDTLIMA